MIRKPSSFVEPIIELDSRFLGAGYSSTRATFASRWFYTELVTFSSHRADLEVDDRPSYGRSELDIMVGPLVMASATQTTLP